MKFVLILFFIAIIFKNSLSLAEAKNLNKKNKVFIKIDE